MDELEAKRDTGERAAALPAVRQSRLVALLDERGQITVSELVSLLEVSRDTIRRDLDVLEERGLLVRTHGGAVRGDRMVRVDTTLGQRMDEHTEAKRRIARAGARLVRDGETLILNGGSTTCYFAGELGARRELTLVTNNLRIPPVVDDASVRALHILGGAYWSVSQVTIGTVGFANVAGIRADTAVIGAAALSAAGPSVGRLEEAVASAAMIDLADRTVLLVDSSKFDTEAFARIAPLERIQHLVTDAAPTGALAEALEAAGTQITLC